MKKPEEILVPVATCTLLAVIIWALVRVPYTPKNDNAPPGYHRTQCLAPNDN